MMKAQGWGDIVNLASTSGMKGGKSGTAYAGSKWAIRGISQCWQTELRPHGVRVTCVCPSEVQTNWSGKTGRNNPNKLYAEDIGRSWRARHAAASCGPRPFANNPGRRIDPSGDGLHLAALDRRQRAVEPASSSDGPSTPTRMVAPSRPGRTAVKSRLGRLAAGARSRSPGSPEHRHLEDDDGIRPRETMGMLLVGGGQSRVVEVAAARDHPSEPAPAIQCSHGLSRWLNSLLEWPDDITTMSRSATPGAELRRPAGRVDPKSA
jgi:hypothetical protein